MVMQRPPIKVAMQCGRIAKAFHYLQTKAGILIKTLDLGVFGRNSLFNDFISLIMQKISGAGSLNYIRAIHEFCEFLLADRPSQTAEDKQLLENIRSIDHMCKSWLKGASRKSSKERVSKKLRILQGKDAILPQLAHLKYLLEGEFEKMESLVTNAQKTTTKGKTVSKSDRTSLLIVRYVFTRLSWIHFHRPGVGTHMMIEEFMNPVDGGGYKVVFCAEHKTIACYPAAVAFTEREYNLILMWYRYVRGVQPRHDLPATARLFVNTTGKHFENGSKGMQRYCLGNKWAPVHAGMNPSLMSQYGSIF